MFFFHPPDSTIIAIESSSGWAFVGMVGSVSIAGLNYQVSICAVLYIAAPALALFSIVSTLAAMQLFPH